MTRVQCSIMEIKLSLKMLYIVYFFALHPFLVQSIEYSDLVALNVSCEQKDSCSRDKGSRLSLPQNWKERNCFCDNLCSDYGDCCLNAANYKKEEQKHSNFEHTCVPLRNYGGVYMITKCSSMWQGDASVASLCAAASPETNAQRPDPFLSTPVTSVTTKFTYANFYCAVCNNDTTDVRSWLPRIECPSISPENRKELMESSDLLDRLKYIGDSWEVTITVDGKTENHQCTVDPFISDDVVEYVRLCKDSISKCPPTYTDTEVIDLCSSYTAVVYHRRTAYRNYHCALCHGLSSDTVSCFDHQYTRFNFKDDFNSAAFSLLFDFTDNSGGNSVGFKCTPLQVWDPFFKKCRNVFCAGNEGLDRVGRCIEIAESNLTTIEEIQNNNIPDLVYQMGEEIFNNSTHKSQQIILFPGETANETTYNVVNMTEEHRSFLNCNRILLPHDEFEYGEGDSVIIPKYHKILTVEEYEVYEDGVLICLSDAADEKFSNAMSWITLAGIGISAVCLILHIIAFIRVPDLRNLSGRNLTSLCVSLLAAYCCFILGVFGEEGKSECFLLGYLMYYFFLASFAWMNVMAFDVWRTLRLATNELRVAGGGQWKKYIIYNIYAWLLPGVGLSLLITIDTIKPSNIPPAFLPEMGQRLCWFGQRKALLVFFATPLSVIMMANFIFFMMAARMIAISTQSAAKFSSCQPYENNFKLYMRLALLMGLAWITGIMAGYLQEEMLWYIFIVLNTLQGMFIFAAFTCKKKVFRAFCCSKNISRKLISPDSSARRGLESRDSNNSQLSQSSDTHLTPQLSTSSTLA